MRETNAGKEWEADRKANGERVRALDQVLRSRYVRLILQRFTLCDSWNFQVKETIYSGESQRVGGDRASC